MNLKRLEGRSAIVTGGANGIGRGCALRLAAEGANVAVIDLDGEAVGSVEAEIRKLGVSAFAIAGDCCNAQTAAEFVGQAENTIGPVDILINNVGQSAREKQGPFLTSEESTWRFVMEINLFTTMRFSRLVAPGMSARKHGRIINMSSESAFVGGKDGHHRLYALAGASACGIQHHRQCDLPGRDAYARH
jgi:acetoacetyl-CoA reductase/3-oxoacyl-[acyl-carrier protein] reductase